MIRKVGGIWFWKVGRFGGSLYLAKPGPDSLSRVGSEITLALIVGTPMGFLLASFWIR